MIDLLPIPSPLLGARDGVRRHCPGPVEAGQPRLPLSYFSSRVTVAAGWAERPCAYLAFGDTDADQIAFAAAHDWPLTALPGRHLHQLVAPEEVAAAITDPVSRV